MAWGFNIAALLNVLPQVATGGTNTGPGASTGYVPGGISSAFKSISNTITQDVLPAAVTQGEGKQK
jgi:hypothetical protein